MPRQPRSALPDGIYHVTARGVGQAAIFLDDLDRVAFMHLLRKTFRKFTWACHVYCLMTNHYHLVVETKTPLLSAGMQRLNGIYAQQFNDRTERVGHVFESRFSSRLVEQETHFCEHVHLRPGQSCARWDLRSGGRLALEWLARRLARGENRRPRGDR